MGEIFPFPAWQPDLTPYKTASSPTMQNVLPRGDGYGPVKTFGAMTSALPDRSGNDSFTKVLLHFEGADSGTVITDSNTGGSAHTWTAAGNAVTDTAQFKFGATSLACDGTGDWVTTPDHADFTLGTSDYTIDFWVRVGSLAANMSVFGHGTDASNQHRFNIFTDGNVRYEVIVAGVSDVLAQASAGAVVINTWYHFAIVRNGSSYTVYKDGVSIATDTDADAHADYTGSFTIGADGTQSNPHNGWVDEFRLSVGTARWTAAFTPPTYAHDTVTSGKCRGFFYARNTDGSISCFAGTISKLYKLNNSTLAWDDVSASLGNYTALGTGFNWQFAQFGSIVIAVQPAVNPQMYTLASSTVFADLTGSPPQAAYIAIVGRFVVLSGLTSTPFTVQWSGLGSAIQWTAGTNFSDSQALPDGGIVRGAAGGEYGVIFQETTIRRMVFNQGATSSANVFDIQKITDDKGLLAPYSLIRAGERIFFLAPQGFHMMEPTGSLVPIGKEKIDRYLFATYDPNNLQLVIGAADPEAPRVYLAYKMASHSDPTFDRILIYDYLLERFSLISQTGEYIASLAAPGNTLESLDAIGSSIDSIAIGSFDDIANSALPKLSIADTNHIIGFFSGPNMEATLETAEQTLEGRMRVKGFRPVTDAATCYGSVGGREHLQTGTTFSTEQLVNTRGLVPANVSTRLARGKIRIPSSTTWTFATGVEPMTTPEGLR